MKIAVLIVRSLVGLIFLVFGLNGFFSFINMPKPPEAASAFFGALAQTGYFLPMLKLTEILSGVLLLANKFSALAMVLLAPIVVNIFLFHAMLAPGGLPLAIFLVLGLAFLGYAYRGSFAGVLNMNAKPNA